MLTNKNLRLKPVWAGLALVSCLIAAGCTPPGPRALLEGKRLMDEGKIQEAVPQLQKATELLPTNALAWSYLGLAYHHKGQLEHAFKAYQTALAIDHTMMALRFNLGCLYLDMNNLNSAIDELRAFSVLQPAELEGWIKLGTAQYRARRLDDAEKSFRSALGVQSRHPEALNGLGLIQLQRRRWQDAVAFFEAAVAADVNYAPAVLNAAIVQHQYLNNRSLALQQYRRYLELNPADAEVVREAVAQLDAAMTPPTQARTLAAPTPTPTSGPPAIVARPVVARTNPAPVVTAGSSVPRVELHQKQTPTNAPAAQPVVAVAPPPARVPVKAPEIPQPPKASNQVRVAVTPGIVAARTAPKPAEKVAEKPPELEVARVGEELVIRPAQAISTSSSSVVSPPDRTTDVPEPATEAVPPPRKGFFSRLNPFSRSPRTSPENGAVVTRDDDGSAREVARTVGPTDHAPSSIVRYTYLSPKRPSDGDRDEAVSAFKRGIGAQKSGDRIRATAEYQSAIRVDPGFFDAYYNLGLVALESGDARLSLWAYELALVIHPDSVDARYNLALALKAGGYPLDAADQLEIILKDNSADVRAHLSLGNLLAQQLKQTRRAREHYLRVLELSPKHPEASSIRYWLAANP